MMQLPPFYPILDSATLARAGMPRTTAAEALLQAGVRILQLRHKGHFDRDTYAEALRAHGHRNVQVIDGGLDLIRVIGPLAKEGGAVVMLGAGSISHWAAALQSQLEGGA